MRICDLNSGNIKLKRSARELREKWELTKDHWNDKTRSDFERQFLEPLAPEITLTVAAILRLAEILEEAEKDCVDEQHIEF